jgi:small-conductance mechanosensitive channel
MLRKAAVAPLAITVFFVFSVAAQQSNAISAKDVVAHLARAVTWYQHVSAIDEGSSLSQNALLRDSSREYAKRALQSSFAFARAQAAILSSMPGSGSSLDAATGAGAMQETLNKASDRVNRLQQHLQTLDSRLEHASGAQRDSLNNERAAIAADLTLAKQMEAALKTMTTFSAPKASARHGLLDEINSLEASNSVAPEKDKPQAKPTDDSLFHPESAGMATLASKVIGYYNTRHQIDMVNDETVRLAQEVDTLRDPLRKSVRAIAAESDTISNSEDTAIQPSEWLATTKQIAELGIRFKQLSTVVIPLGEMAMALQSVRGSLNEWRKQIQSDYSSTLRYLLIRLGVLLGGALLILLGSAIWQRAIDHYVAEPRRRRQLSLVKRVFVALALALLLTFGFFSSLSSIATLLGFVTAGLALALQNVILSAVAYFFLIGRYGLRVGDRITVQGVTGEVVEVGFIRLFLMEMIGSGTEIHPTGRLAVFANSVIFQPAALMKQAPGLEYAWHSVKLTVENPVDSQQARTRLTQAVTAVFEDYRPAIERQNKTFEQTTHVSANSAVPTSQAQFTENGLEVTIRYPVSLSEKPGRIDERMIDRLLVEAETEPKLKFAAGGSPKTSKVV